MSSTLRPIAKVASAMRTRDGEGADVLRVIGGAVHNISPFIMLDEFIVRKPGGFPMHPHRGQITVTLMLEGSFRHRDNKGNSGTIFPGDMQFMTAGRGIVHEELPNGDGLNRGMQLWINLPAKYKMVPANYQDKKNSEILTKSEDGCDIRVLTGNSHGVDSPVETYNDISYLQVKLAPNRTFEERVPAGFNGFVYLYEGSGVANGSPVNAQQIAVFAEGEEHPQEESFQLKAGEKGAEFVFLTGRPLNEPFAQHGPFVMNTREELLQAVRDYSDGKF